MNEYPSVKSSVDILETWAHIVNGDTCDLLTDTYKLVFDLVDGEYVLRGEAHFNIPYDCDPPYVLALRYSPNDLEPFASVTLQHNRPLVQYDIMTVSNLKLPKEVGLAVPEQPANAMARQEGGSHYKGFKIQPVVFCQVNGLTYCESSAIKYLCRWRDKGGLEDLKKAKHFIDMLIEIEGLE